MARSSLEPDSCAHLCRYVAYFRGSERPGQSRTRSGWGWTSLAGGEAACMCTTTRRSVVRFDRRSPVPIWCVRWCILGSMLPFFSQGGVYFQFIFTFTCRHCCGGSWLVLAHSDSRLVSSPLLSSPSLFPCCVSSAKGQIGSAVGFPFVLRRALVSASLQREARPCTVSSYLYCCLPGTTKKAFDAHLQHMRLG